MSTSNDTRLDSSDIGILIEALKAWEEKDLAGEMLVDILASVIATTPQQKMEAKTEREAARAERDSKRQWRREQSVVLQAKLIQMRNATDANAFISGALAKR